MKIGNAIAIFRQIDSDEYKEDEKAIERLKSADSHHTQAQYNLDDETIHMAITALEKQILKNIIYDYGLNETRCPACNTIFGYAYEEDESEDLYYAPYCYECGQCLDWEEMNADR